MRRWLISRLGGYPDIDSAIEAIKEKDMREKYDILSLAVRRLFNTFGPENILTENSAKQFMYEGKIMSEGQKQLVIQEASALINMFIWKVLKADVKYKANKMMFQAAVNEAQIASGKIWLFTFDAFETRLKSLAAGSGHFNSGEEKK